MVRATPLHSTLLPRKPQSQPIRGAAAKVCMRGMHFILAREFDPYALDCDTIGAKGEGVHTSYGIFGVF